MSLIRLLINSPIILNDSILIDGDDAHYLMKVMRKREGDEFLVFNGVDGEWRAKIISISKKDLLIQTVAKQREQSYEKKLSLIFSPVKNPDASWIVTKVTELGVTDIYPVLTSRSVVKKINLSKLEIAAKEASEQCNRITKPKIYDFQELEFRVRNLDSDFILLDETGEGESPAKALAKKMDSPCLIIGPEGGFTKEELDFIKSQNSCISITLGARILRAETAVLAGLSLYQGLLGDW